MSESEESGAGRYAIPAELGLDLLLIAVDRAIPDTAGVVVRLVLWVFILVLSLDLARRVPRFRWLACLVVAVVIGLAAMWSIRAASDNRIPSAHEIAVEVKKELQQGPAPAATPQPVPPSRESSVPKTLPPVMTTHKANVQAAQLQSRIRISNVIVFDAAANTVAHFPGVNIYYNNVGPLPAIGTVVHYGVALADGQLSSDKVSKVQNDLLAWAGWADAFNRRKEAELYQGDPDEFTTVPPADDDTANLLRSHWQRVADGKDFLYVFVTFKYRDESMGAGTFGVTESCFWFSNGFSRHICGRSRSFLERH